MSIKRTIITTVVALAMVAMVAPVNVSAVTIEELLAQIATLQSQLLALQGGSTPVPTGAVACSGITFTRNLTIGSTGSDVKCLQVLLNNNGYTIAQSGAGSPGAETSYFGSLTLAAVKSFQVAKGWTPANQVGPMTRAALNALISSTPGTPGTPVTPTGAGLSVQLAYDNPVANSVVAGQALAPLAKLTFVNGDNAEVKITTLKLQRGGISSDSSLTSIYLFNGAVRLTDAASISAGVISFNDSTGLFTVPAGGSKTITVLADIYASATGTVSVNLNSSADITTNASSVKGSYPISGNIMTFVSGGSLATAYFSTATAATSNVNPTGTSSSSGIDPQADYPVWYTNLNVSISNGYVKMSRLALREVGSINYSDIQNFRLYVDGMQVGSAVPNLDANGYVTFDLTSNPVSMQAGARAIKVMADIIGGSSRYFTFQLKTAADITLTDSQYNVNIIATDNVSGTTHTIGALRSCYYSAGTAYQCYINSGATTATRMTDSPSGNVVNQASGVTLAKWQLKSNGERIKVDSLKAYVLFGDTTAGSVADDTASATSATLRNGVLYANGVQIGNTSNIPLVTSGFVATVTPVTFNLGSSLILDPLTPVTLEMKADIYDNATTNDIDATDTLTAYLVIGSGNGQGMVSSNSVNVPTGTVTGNQLTVSSGGLTLSKYTAYTDQATVPPQTGYKLAHFTLTANTTEAVNLNTIYADTTFLSSWASNLYVQYGTQQTTAKATASGTADGNSWSVNYQLPAGQTIDVIVYADISSSAAGSAVGAKVKVAGTTASSGTAVCAGTNTDCSSYAVLSGQTVSYTSGSATAAADGSTPIAASIAGGQQVTVAKFKLSTLYDSYNIQEMKFTVPSNADRVIQSLILKDGTSTLATVAFDGTQFNVTGLNVPVLANSTKVLTVDLLLSNPYTNWNGSSGVTTTGRNTKVTLSYVKALTSQGVVKEGDGSSLTDITFSSSIAGNNTYVYKSIPTFTLVNDLGTTQGGALTGGSDARLYHFQVKADTKGDIALKQLKFITNVVNNTGAAAYLTNFKLFRGSTDLTASSAVRMQNTAGTTMMDGTATIASGTAVATFTTEETIGAGATNDYYLVAQGVNFGCSSGSCDTVSVYLPIDAAITSTSSGDPVNALYWLSAAGDSETTVQQLHSAPGGGGSDTDAYVIWSDNSALSHTYDTTASSSDWFNGYNIINLPLSSVGTVAQ